MNHGCGIFFSADAFSMVNPKWAVLAWMTLSTMNVSRVTSANRSPSLPTIVNNGSSVRRFICTAARKS